MLRPASLVAVMLGVTTAAATTPDTFLARVETLASIETLNAQILASASATRALERWCAVHAIAAEPRLRADLVHDADEPLDEAGRERLGIGPREPVRYRHVRLTCGDHVLSEADNWYVPARLTPEMNRQLETTDTPFGKAVAALHFTRETFAVDGVWSPLPDDWQIRPPPPDHPDRPLAIPTILFTHHAVLYDGAHRPFSEVAEHYTRETLAFERTPKASDRPLGPSSSASPPRP